MRTSLLAAGLLAALCQAAAAGEPAQAVKIIADLKTLAAAHPQASRIHTFLFLKKFPTDVRHNSKIIREKLTQLATGH